MLLFWNVIAYHSLSECVYFARGDCFFLSFSLVVSNTLLIILTWHNLHEGERSFKLHVRFSNEISCSFHHFLTAIHIIVWLVVDVVVCCWRLNVFCYWFLWMWISIKATRCWWWYQNARFRFDCVLDSLCGTTELVSTFTLTMIRWYMSNDQTHNKLSETDWDERLNRTTNIYKFYWFSAARWCSMVLVCSDAVGRCYSIFCVCIYFVERLDFDTRSTQSSVAWKRDEKEEDEWSQHTTIPFLYLLRRSVLLVYLCTDEKRKRPLYIRGGNIRVGIFAAVFGIQLRYDDEGRIIFSDILRVCFRSIISTALWIIAPKPFLLMDSFSLSPKHHTENRKFLAFFVCVIYFSCSCIDFQMRLHELVFSIDCLSHAILLLLSA